MQIGSYEVDIIFIDEHFGDFFLLFAVVSGKAEKVDLEEYAVVVEFVVAFAFVVVINVAFGVGENGSESFHDDLKKDLVEVESFLNVGVFHEQIVAMQASDDACFELLDKHFVDTIFGRVVHFDVDAGLRQAGAKFAICLRDDFRGVFKGVLRDVRGDDKFFKAPIHHTFDKFDRPLYGRGTVVNARDDMAMDVGSEKKLFGIVRFFIEKIKHAHLKIELLLQK